MDNKSYILGLGSGIIVCALVMYIALLMSDGAAPVVIDDQDIIRKAIELGMIMPVDNETETINDINNKDEKSQNESEEANDSEVLETSIENNEEPEYVTFVVDVGSSSYAVTSTLYEKGLIDNEDDFNQFLIDNDYNTKIRPGTFTILKGYSYEELARILMGR